MEVSLIDKMGTDLTVVNAARVSFNKESDWEFKEAFPSGPGFPVKYDPHLSEKDQKLIKYLATHNHWTPFSHVQITMREKVPIFVARQRFKHMVGFTYNEVSRRYVDEAPEFYIPETWRGAPEGSKKQGSSEKDVSLEVSMTFGSIEAFHKRMAEAYQMLLDAGVAPEQARMVLPQSMYTEYYVTGSLAAWARAYNLRSAKDAQKEIQELAGQWDKIISDITELKYSWEAIKDGSKTNSTPTQELREGNSV